jgi:hypothetical protein
MKIFFYMGRNSANKSGVSWKIWKIKRSDRTVTVFWGPAKLHRRKVTPVGTLQSKTRRFRSAEVARDFEIGQIQSKLNKGYERRTRSRAT